MRLLLCTLTVLLVASPALLLAKTVSAENVSPATARANSSAEDKRIRIQLVSPDAVTLSSELAAKIAELPLKEGEAFKHGDKLVSFECSLYDAQFKKAEAIADSARKLLQVNKRMSDLQSVGELELEQSAAKLREAEAEQHYMETSVSKCVIRAPFNGRVAKRLVAQHQYVNTGTPLLDVIGSEQLELQMIVPSNWLAWLKPGQAFTVNIEELGKAYAAEVVRLGARIDPLSQTIPITGKLTHTAPELLTGMSGWADITPP